MASPSPLVGAKGARPGGPGMVALVLAAMTYILIGIAFHRAGLRTEDGLAKEGATLPLPLPEARTDEPWKDTWLSQVRRHACITRWPTPRCRARLRASGEWERWRWPPFASDADHVLAG